MGHTLEENIMATSDDEMTFSHNLDGISPCRGDDDEESSVDIYDDLDSTPNVSISHSSEVTPATVGLNLFDEILIEEGTAKEATYKDLQAEHEKCQQQIQDFMKKLKEIEEQNTALQNENQSLKKNISALIKTARVEIKRKDDEISTLQRRLSEIAFHQNTHARTYFTGSTSNARNFEGSKAKNKLRDVLQDKNLKTDPKAKHALTCKWDTENKKFHSETRDNLNRPQTDPEQLDNEGTYARLVHINGPCDKEKKKEIKASENDYRCESKAHQNPDELLDTHQKLQVNSQKTDRNGLWKITKDLKLRNNLCTEIQTNKVCSAGEKQLMPKEKLLPKIGHLKDSRDKKSENIKHKDSKPQKKEENVDVQKNRQSDKCLEEERTNMLIGPHEKNAIVCSPPKLNKSRVEDRKIKDTDGRRNRGSSSHRFQGDKLSSSLCPVSIKEQKCGHSKENDRKCGHTHSKSNRHRTEEKRKNKRDSPSEDKNSLNERDSEKTSHKKARGAIAMKEGAKEERFFQAEDNGRKIDNTEEHLPTKAGKDEEQSKSKDLKLSFMQKLNLTLSPAKKQTDKLKVGAKPSNEYADIPNLEKALVQSVPPSSNTTKETTTTLFLASDNRAQTNMEKITSGSETEKQIGNSSLAETLHATFSNTSFQPNMAEQYPLSDTKIEMEDVDETFVAPPLGSPMDQRTPPESCFSDLETISSVDFDTFRVIDEVTGSDSDSLVDEGEARKCADRDISEGREKGSDPVPSEAAVEEAKIPSADMSENDPKVHNLKPSISDRGNHPETLCDQGGNPPLEPGDTDPVLAEDESSILSIDLNQMRCIPKAISPLSSPVRPLPNVLKTESPYKGPVRSYNAEGAIICSGRSQASEINKENQKPLHTDHPVLEESHLSRSSNELEEGEIVSDDAETKTEQNSESSKTVRRKTYSDRSDFPNSKSNHKAKSTSSSEDSGKLNCGKGRKEKPHGRSVRSSKDMKKNKTVSIDCLEKIVQVISEPSSVHEFMNMMRAIRKQIRKKYMKFKIQFPVQHFHRIIDSAVLNFTSLVKYLNFSKMTKSSETLKLNLCEVIESKLNQIKKNSAIEHLFRRQQSDMKKKLWKLVDEQLDHLFDKIKKILLKLCNLKNFGNENGEKKLDKRMKGGPECLVNCKSDKQKSKKPALNDRTKKPEDCTLAKPAAGGQLPKRDHQDTNEPLTHKNAATKSKQSYTGNTKYSETKAKLLKEKSIDDTSLKTEKYEKEESQMIGDPHKTDISCGPLTEQQMSGLTFNLVNDAQMGEMFKSLLQGSDFSEKNDDFIDEHQWEFRTPEKHTAGDQGCGDDSAYEAEEPVPNNSQVESRVLDGIKWPTVSPERDSTFVGRLPMPVDPDILDESCMFEMPTDPALKKGEGCVSEKPKSLVSSILLEDLAVSLTIPSPLKSDAHLSFLKPDVLGSVPEDVLSAHFSEDAHLEEEDVSEQDIHLALDSDNSSGKSSCSSSWATIPAAPGFQYCPSLPMQAVIMEKSNDHFIVKIRRAAPSTSPVCDQSTGEPLACLAENGSSELMAEEQCATLDSENIALEEKMPTENNVNIVDSEESNASGKKEVSSSPEFVKETSVYQRNGQEPVQSKPRIANNVLVSVETWCGESRQNEPCNMLELLKEPYSKIRKTQHPELLGSHQLLRSEAGQEITSVLQDPTKELEESFDSLKESSSKTSQRQEIPDIFKLPQMHTVDVFGKRDVLSLNEYSAVSSVAVPLAEELPSKCHFDICIDMNDEAPTEKEVDSWALTGQSALNDIPGNLHKEVLKTEACSEVSHLSEQVVNLMEDLPDKPKLCGNIETKTVTNDSGQECEINVDKESKKRKKETEGTSSVKRQKRESNLLVCKKNISNKKSKEITSVSTSALNEQVVSTRDKDLPLSTLSKSTSNLCAKNIIKKKGEVVISWTRNDDREILLECQKKGPSEKTFASLAAKLNKNLTQVEERFRQLVKLFKMSNCS